MMEPFLEEWIKTGFSSHEASKWYYREFTLEEALIWKKHGFELVDACCFRTDEISASEAKQLIIEEIKESF